MPEDETECRLCGDSIAEIGENEPDGLHWTCEIETLYKLVEAQERLLVAYRLGRRPEEKTLDVIEKTKKLLKIA